MREFLDIARALGDEGRTRILMFLRNGELCGCQITEILALAPSTVSKHLTVLQRAGLVKSRKEGKWTYYGLAEQQTSAVRNALGWAQSALNGDDTVAEDVKRLAAVLKMRREKLCGNYRGRFTTVRLSVLCCDVS